MTIERQRFQELLGVARGLTFEEARVLSRLYDDDPASVAGRARKKADAALKGAGLEDTRVAWLREAGSAVIQAQSADPWDPTHDEPWRWATQTVLDAVRAILAAPYLQTDEVTALESPIMSFQTQQ